MKAEINRRLNSRKTHHALRRRPARILTAVPICDGHDSAILTINLELAHHGIEVIYLGYHRPVRDIVRAAIQEDVAAIGLSSYNGGHVEFFSEVLAALKRGDATHVGVFGGGGGTITAADAQILRRRGVDEIFSAGTPLDAMMNFVKRKYGVPKPFKPAANGTKSRISDHTLARLLTLAERGGQFRSAHSALRTPVLGIAGPGGAGKTTLIDELVLRFLRARPNARLAILSHDPSMADHGALLGDRATMIHSQHDRVFMRSLGTRGRAGGLSPATERCLHLLAHAGFDLVLVETAGIGQEALPFARRLVDKAVLVMSPGYGGRLQLQKTAMLDTADVVVVNKSDLSGAKTAAAEIGLRLAQNRRGQKLFMTVAKQHGDPGVDQLFAELVA